MAEKIKVLVTGSTGLVGSHFVEKVKDFDLITPTSKEFNLQDIESVSAYLDKHKPDWIINFAAYTDVGKADQEKGDENGLVWKTNVEGVKNILEAFKSENFIQISTDMVFPGNSKQPGPYKETDVIPETSESLTWYGWTKNRAESLVNKAGGVILRIIYPISFEFDKKFDYLKNPVKRFADGKMYPLFNDQQISVTYIEEISEVLRQIILRNLHGVFHVSSDMTTPFELIKKSLEEMGEDASALKTSSVIEFLKTQDNPARYPVFGGLDTKATSEKLGMKFSSWKEVVLKIPHKSSGPREYKYLEIANTVVINPTKYPSRPDGYVMETADFTELGYFLGYKFEPRSMYAIWSPEGVGRGGHLESRSKLVTVISGLVYYCLVDTREGEGYLRTSEFYLGEGKDSVGRSVLVPEGVVDYFIPVEGPATTHSVGDRPYNKFDNRVTLDMTDPDIGLHIPEGSLHNISEDEDSTEVSLAEFIEKRIKNND